MGLWGRTFGIQPKNWWEVHGHEHQWGTAPPTIVNGKVYQWCRCGEKCDQPLEDQK